MISSAEIGITDCTRFIGTGTLTSVSPARIGMIHTPMTPSTAKNAITSTCATMLIARRHGHGARSTSSGQPMCARLTDASAEP